MKKIRLISNQSLMDLAVQLFGNVGAAFDLGHANGLSVTADLYPGQELEIPESLFKDPDVQRYFAGRDKKIATNLFPAGGLSPEPEGIGFMIIEDTFIVS